MHLISTFAYSQAPKYIFPMKKIHIFTLIRKRDLQAWQGHKSWLYHTRNKTCFQHHIQAKMYQNKYQNIDSWNSFIKSWLNRNVRTLLLIKNAFNSKFKQKCTKINIYTKNIDLKIHSSRFLQHVVWRLFFSFSYYTIFFNTIIKHIKYNHYYLTSLTYDVISFFLNCTINDPFQNFYFKLTLFFSYI